MKALVNQKWASAARAAGLAPRVSVVPDNPDLQSWELLVQKEAQAAANGRLFIGPVHVGLLFQLPRPQSIPRKFLQPYRKPDVDKLARAVLDGLTHTLIRDDAQVVELQARKVYADPDLDQVGVIVTVYEVGNP